MTAAELLSELRELGVDVCLEADGLHARPAHAVPPELRPLLIAHRDALLDLAPRTCPGCGVVDYLPLARGWRRCWSCGRRRGVGQDPGEPPGPADPAQPLAIRGLP